MDVLISFAVLAFPILLGMAVGAWGLFADINGAIATLNRYALYIAFPALIAAGLTHGTFTLPADVAFWVLVPLAMVCSAGITYCLSVPSSLRTQRGTLAMVGLFGNVAYVGLPLCERLLGADITGLASLAVSFFVVFSLLIGATLLLVWSPDNGTRSSPIRLIFRQPLLWSPILGLGLRWTPWMDTVHALLEPVGHSAAPVALFLLGLYLYAHRAAALKPSFSGLAHVTNRLFVFPLIMTALVMGALQWGVLQKEAGQVFILLAATPTAVATFALSVEFKQGQEDVAQSIVLSTIAAGLTLPIVSIWVLAM